MNYRQLVVGLFVGCIMGLLAFSLYENISNKKIFDRGKFQAVFLSNGQVYFGNLSGINTEYPVLTNVYYLIVTRPLQDQSGKQQPGEPEFSLRKLGSEVHGPSDKMFINNKHILFVEDLTDTSKVVEAIKQTNKVTTPNESSSANP